MVSATDAAEPLEPKLWTRTHWALAFVCCVALPGASWLDGTGWLAWTMYARSETYRLRIQVEDASGPRLIAPTELGFHADRSVQIALSGTETWRHAPYGITLRSRLPALAALACRVTQAARVEVLLEQRRTLDAPIERTRAAFDCRTGARLP